MYAFAENFMAPVKDQTETERFAGEEEETY
jgi:hypothetical protein